jgi:hypothetical protein
MLTEEALALTKMNDSHRTPNKQGAKPATNPEDQETLPSPEPNQRRLRNQEHETEQMKKIFENFIENKKNNSENREKNMRWKSQDMKWANMDTQNLLTTKTTPTQTMNDHII